jgi:hypothetical protein
MQTRRAVHGNKQPRGPYGYHHPPSGEDRIREMTRVSILCAAPNSVYWDMSGLDVYDMSRDARTFKGDTPVVAHPPCRAWSAFCGHQAKPLPGEKELGIWCCDQVIACGGILEQPAHSRLFSAGQLPLPNGSSDDMLWSAEVWQAWWGFPFKKATWLCFSGISRRTVEFPLRLHDPRGDRQRWNTKSKHQRAATCREFAEWLVTYARVANRPVARTLSL